MLTPDQRLDRLEPIISELLAKQDETAAKIERVFAQVRQLTVTVTNVLTAQSSNIEFLLNRTQQLTEGQTRLEARQAQLADGQAQLEQKVSEGFGAIDQRFNQLVSLLNEKLK